jgi:signal transduction histidine kinase
MHRPLSALLVLAAVLAVGCTGTPGGGADATTTTPAAGSGAGPTTPAELATFVEEARAYVASAGEGAALAEFQRRDGRFSRGTAYIYAYDHGGTLLAHPYQPDLVGQDRSNWTDARGLPFVRVGETIASHGGGYLAYLYPSPENGTIDERALDSYEPKVGYVAPAGDRVWIGSGVYLADMARNATGADPVSEMVGLVDRAAAAGRSRGKEAALAAISARSGALVDPDGHHVYAYDFDGMLLAHPQLAGQVGSVLIERRDRFGMEPVRALADTARAGGGYVVYVWPNPANGDRDELAIGYVLPVDDAWWVGSGAYLSEITGADAPLPGS